MAGGDGDYESLVSSLIRGLERRLLDEHHRIIACREINLQAVIASLQQKHRTLRQKLYYRGLAADSDNNELRCASSTENGQFVDFPEELLPEFPEEQAFRHSPGNTFVVNGLLSTPRTTPRTPGILENVACTPRSPQSPRQPGNFESKVEDVSAAKAAEQVEQQGENRGSEYRSEGVTGLSARDANGLSAGRLALWPEWELVDEDMPGLDNYLQSYNFSALATSSNLKDLTPVSSQIDEDEDEPEDVNEEDEDEHDSRALQWYTRVQERDRWSYLVIEPDSTPAQVWEYIGLPLLFYDIMTIPMQVFELPKNAMFLTVMTPVILAYWSLDIVRNMFQGYYRKDGTKVMKLRKIMVKYVCSVAFAFDFFLVAADALYIFFVDSNILSTIGMARVSKFLKVWHMLSLLRLLRLRKISTTMDLLQEKIDCAMLSALINVVGSLGVIMTINHIIACLWYFIGTHSYPGGTRDGYRNWTSVYFEGMNRAESWQYMFLTSLHWSVCQFTPGSMAVQPQNPIERAVAIAVLMFAMLVFSSFVGAVTNAFSTAQSFSAKHRQEILMFRRYCRQHKVSEDLALRVDRYIALLPQSHLGGVQFKDVKLFNLLTAPLRNELLTELHMPHLTVHPFFEKLSKRCNAMVRKLCCSAVKQESLSMQDVLFATGQISNDMIFVTKGTLHYMMKHPNGDTGYIIKYLRETNWCCELTLWTRWLHTGSMYVATECTVLLLNSQQFRVAVCEYHLDMRLVKAYASLFVSFLNEMSSKGKFVSDIISEDVLESPRMLRFLSGRRYKGLCGSISTLEDNATTPRSLSLSSHSATPRTPAETALATPDQELLV